MSTADGDRHGMFESLSVRNYRLYFTGGMISNTGTWVARVAQDWLVLTILTNNSATALGLVTTLQFLWVPLLSPWSGSVADRFPKRRVLLVSQTVMAFTSALLATLVLGGHVQLWHVYVLASVQGLTMAFDGPARQALASEMVPPRLLMNAVSLNSASFNAGRMFGPAIGGLLIAGWGVGVGIAVNAVSFIPVLIALAMMRESELASAPLRRGRGAAIEGIRYVRGRPDLLLVMAMVFMLGVFAMNFQVTNALMTTTVFDKGAKEFGLLGSIMAIGSLAAALWNAKRSRPRLRTLVVAIGLLGLVIAAMAAAPSFWLFAALLVPAGLCMLTVLTTSNSMVQLSVDAAVRGRVMALYMAIQQGGMPIGAALAGVVSDHVGVRWMLMLGAVVTVLTAFAATAWVARGAGGIHALRESMTHGDGATEVAEPEA